MSTVHNQLKNVPDELKGLNRAFGALEDAAVERLGETLQPVIDIRQFPEYAFHRKERLGGATYTTPAVAGNSSIVTLQNPAASNRIVVVDELSGANETGADALIVILCTIAQVTAVIAGALTGNTFDRDGRWGAPSGTNVPQCICRRGSVTGPPGGTQMERVRHVAGGHAFFDVEPFVLIPGAELAIITVTINQILTANFKFRERVPLRGELLG